MIRISCTNCKTVLSIDDAFAGGVCRCQHCGTIQTVPSQARQGSAQAVPSGQLAGSSKSLYHRGATNGSALEETGLDDLAGVVASSGLTSSRLKRSSESAGSSRKLNLLPVVIGSTVVVAVLLVIIIVLLTRGSGASPSNTSGNGSTNTIADPSPAAANTATFCGTPLTGNTVIYLLDCGSATKDFLGELKDATIKSVESLGPDRKFQIMFWNNGTDGAYPEGTTTFASKENISAAQKAIDDVAPFGQSDVKTALQLAIAQHPDEIVLATGKGWDLDNKWLDDVLAIRGSSPVKINTCSLGNNTDSAPLKKLAAQTNGSYHELSQADLRSFGQ